MRQARQGLDWGIVIVALFSLLAALPFLLNEGLPRTNASEAHVFMAADYADSLRDLRLYPRWSAAALGGYGAPIPNFYPPGAPYFTALLNVFFVDDPVLAVRLVYVLALLLAGTLTYTLVMRQSGAGAGVLAAVLYVYSPYIGFTAPHAQGDLPGMLAAGLLPLLLWAVHRLAMLNRPGDYLLVALTAAALLLTQPLVFLAGVGLAFVLTLWLRTGRVRNILAVLAGVLLVNFYWFPALVEQEAVYWTAQAVTGLGHQLEAITLISPLRRVDLNEMVITPQFTLGWGILIFAALGFVSALRRPQGAGFHLLFLFCGAVIAGIGVLALPSETWLLGPLTLCLSIGGSGLVRGVGSVNSLDDAQDQPSQRLILPVLLVLALYLALPVWLPPEWPAQFGGTSAADQINYEQQGYGQAVLPPRSNIPVPRALPSPVRADRSLVSSYQAGSVVRLAPGQLTAEVQASQLSSTVHEDRFLVNLSRPANLLLLRASFPGWEAYLNGVSVPLHTDSDTGLLRVELPAVRDGDLVIRLGTTPVRRASWIVSGIILGALLLLTTLRLRRMGGAFYDSLMFIEPAQGRLLVFCFAGLLGMSFLFGSPETPITLHERPGYGLDNTRAVRSRTSSGLEALSFDLNRVTYQPGDMLDVMIAWRTPRALLRNYRTRIFLMDAEVAAALTPASRLNFIGERAVETSLRHPGGYPTRRWSANQYVRDPYRLELPETLDAGQYRLGVEVYDCDAVCTLDDRLLFFDSQGQLQGVLLLLPATIQITGEDQ